jgi:hypothetical protein
MKAKVLTLPEIRQLGLEALAQKLGPEGMLRFLQQFEPGAGDYSVERHSLLPKLGVRALAEEIRTAKRGRRSPAAVAHRRLREG